MTKVGNLYADLDV